MRDGEQTYIEKLAKRYQIVRWQMPDGSVWRRKVTHRGRIVWTELVQEGVDGPNAC